MTTQRWQQIERLLDEVLDLDRSAQAAFLDTACADDPVLRREVEALLAAEEGAPAFLDEDAVAFAGPVLDEEDMQEAGLAAPGQRLGRYRLLREIGHGGMSVVYLAERADGQFRQHVAVKLLRHPGSAREVRQRRFRTEQQILASLHHPHIAQVYDGGVTEGGWPYLVMEYVEGLPLTDYCDMHRLGIDACLRLFEQVCEAVQHAHQSLVVHRDLKPSNILVAADGHVKLLDFGIAKLLADDATDFTITPTGTGMRLLTPQYAAPEQVRGEAITTATDVYALGVLLYELVTGHRPYELTGKSPSEVERIVCEDEPTKPSTAVAETDEASRSMPAPPGRLQQVLRGDLDTIVLKALRKEPEARYGTAQALIEDLRRYRARLPVNARAATIGYRVKKFVQRHRVGVVLAAAFAVLMVGGGMLVAWQQAATARERDRAQTEAQTSREVTTFMVGLFEASSPYNSQGDTLTAPDLLQRGVERAALLKQQPQVHAQLLDAMGQAYLAAGLHDQADTLFGRALATWRSLDDQPVREALRTQWSVAVLRHHQGDYAASDSLYRRLLPEYRTLVSPDLEVAQVLRSYGELLIDTRAFETAEEHLQEALTLMQSSASDSPLERAKVQHALGSLYVRMGEYESAEPLLRQVLTVRSANLGVHPDVATSLSYLAGLMERMGNYDEAEELHRNALSMERALFGPGHFRVGTALNSLGLVLYRRGKYEAAEMFYKDALDIKRRAMGSDHPSVAIQLYNLASLLQKKGSYAEAEPLYRQVLAIDQKVLGPEHPEVGVDRMKLATLLYDKGDYEEAEAQFTDALDLLRRTLPDDHPRLAEALDGWGRLLVRKGSYGEADRILHEALTIRRAKLGEGHPDTRRTRERLVELYEKWGKPEKAAAYRASKGQ